MGAKSRWSIGSKLADDCLVGFNHGALRGLKRLPSFAAARSARRGVKLLNSCRDCLTFLP